MNKYADIINLKRHISKNHKQMSNHDRAAQFAPFAALVGHNEALRECIRLTDDLLEYDDDILIFLNQTLNIIENRIKEHPKIKIRYFIYDHQKDGGKYQTKIINVRKIDYFHRIISSMDYEDFNLDLISHIEILS